MKRLLFTALGLAVALPGAALAQSNVILKGIVDVGPRYDSGGTNGSSTTSLGSGQSAGGSRLTFEGVEDLGGGLKASFVLETGIALDTGMGTSNPPGVSSGALTFGRTSAVAIGNDKLGYLSLGRQYNPIWALTAGTMADPFGASWLGGANIVNSSTGKSNNSIAYSYGYTWETMLRAAPKKGLGVAAIWSIPETVAPLPASAGQQLGFNVSYGIDKWWAGYAYHQINGSSTDISATAPVTDQPKLQQQALEGSYDFGFARVNLGFNRATNGLNGTVAGALDRNNWHIAATIPFAGNQVLMAEYGKANNNSAVNSDWSTFQVGYQYSFSLRTTFYAVIGQVYNDANVNVALLGSLGTYAKGSTPRSVISGLRMTF